MKRFPEREKDFLRERKLISQKKKIIFLKKEKNLREKTGFFEREKLDFWREKK